MIDPETIYNWRRIHARLTTSGQPTQAQLAAIAALGVRHVVNLAPHEHEDALPDEAARCAKLGMAYTNIPVVFSAPQDEAFVEFCAVMKAIGDEPAHVHCMANMRVTAFLYRYWRDVLGMEDDAARAPMDAFWRPGGVWASFIGDDASTALPHRPPVGMKAWP